MHFKHIFSWFSRIFKGRKEFTLGLYGNVNTGKSTLANRISKDWTGEEMSKASEVPHETRSIVKKEHVELRVDGKKINLNLLDMPGIATKVDYREFLPFGIKEEEAQLRAKEATKGIIEAIKWLEKVDVALVIMDASQDPYTQVNITLLGNLEARGIPLIIVANKMDLKKANPNKIRQAFPQHKVLEISAITGQGMQDLYKEIVKVWKVLILTLNIEFLTQKTLGEKKDKLAFLLDSLKKQKILVFEGSLSKTEEKDLIERTMNEIDQQSFTGIEIASFGEESNFIQKLIQLLGGRKSGFTVIGPANLVKEIKRDPSKLNILAGD